jgi:hypothetical protein
VARAVGEEPAPRSVWADVPTGRNLDDQSNVAAPFCDGHPVLTS